MVKIKVIGIGGAGCNAISRLKKTSLNNVELIAINTDLQQLSQTLADFKLQIGKKITQGLGTGMKPEIGEEAAKESIEEIREILKKTDLLFLVFGGGGGTGTGAAPVIAEVAKNQGILTLAVVATPFSFEGKTRRAIAKEGIEKLKNFIDGIIVVENDRLLKTLPPKTSLSEAFWFSDSILQNAVKSILNILTKPALIGINFADIKEIFEGAGTILIGIAKAEGENRAEKALSLAFSSPLLNFSPKGAKNALFFVEGEDVSLGELQKINQILVRELNPGAKVIFGLGKDPKLKTGEIQLTLFLSGF